MKKKKLNWEELEKKATYNPIIEETEEEPIKKKRRKRKKINIKKIGENKTLLATIIFIIILVIMIFSVIFAILNINNNNILNGVKIEGIDVSGLSREEAKAKIETVYNAKKEEDIILKYNDFETTISQDILETNYDLDKAVNEAISLGKDGNIITNNYNILFALLGKKNIKVDMSINEEQIKDEIENIQTNIPGTIIEPDYYVENDKLIITPGQEGIKISVDNLINRIKNTLKTSSSNQQYIEIPMDNVWPDKIDIEKIHDEIYKEVQDAYLTENPITIHPEVEGVDFDIEEAKKILENMISKTKLHEIDILKVKKYYEDAVDKRIIVLNEPLFYKDYLPYTEAMFVVYPSNRGGFAAQGVTKDSYTNELKKEFPLEWVNNLPNYLRFCHTSRFLVASDTFEGIMYAVREALK